VEVLFPANDRAPESLTTKGAKDHEGVQGKFENPRVTLCPCGSSIENNGGPKAAIFELRSGYPCSGESASDERLFDHPDH
jgi:hypothetical protein